MSNWFLRALIRSSYRRRRRRRPPKNVQAHRKNVTIRKRSRPKDAPVSGPLSAMWQPPAMPPPASPQPQQTTRIYNHADDFLHDRPRMEQEGWTVAKQVEQWQPPFNVFVTYQRTSKLPLQPGQFQSTTSSVPPQPRWYATFQQWFIARSKRTKFGLVGVLVVVCLLGCGALAIIGNAAQSQPSATQSVQAASAPATTMPTPTARPKATPTASPTPKPTPRPKPKPTQPPPTLTLTFTCASAVDYSSGQVCVHTEPGAALTITVRYCSGYKATSDSLQGTVYANSAGNYEWTWEPETECRGAATAYVTASWNGQSASNSDGFTVQ